MLIEYPADPEAMQAPACRLPPDAMQTRGQEWASLRRDYLIERQQIGQVVLSHWRSGSADPLRQLILAERECCSFLGFRLTVDSDRVTSETIFPPTVSPDQFAGVG